MRLILDISKNLGGADAPVGGGEALVTERAKKMLKEIVEKKGKVKKSLWSAAPMTQPVKFKNQAGKWSTAGRAPTTAGQRGQVGGSRMGIIGGAAASKRTRAVEAMRRLGGDLSSKPRIGSQLQRHMKERAKEKEEKPLKIKEPKGGTSLYGTKVGISQKSAKKSVKKCVKAISLLHRI